MFLENSIGDSYKDWKAGDCIFISAPTGSGKTYFILKKLLKYLSSQPQEKKILYLVNRSILKQQVEKEISKLSYEQKKLIKVELYQTIENMITELECVNYAIPYARDYIMSVNSSITERNRRRDLPSQDMCTIQDYDNGTYNKLGWVNEYDYVVCDEAHYFLMDSNYNTNTCWSFRFINESFDSKVRIYMSATIEEIMNVVKNDNKKKLYYRTSYFGINNKKNCFPPIVPNEISISFSEGRNYDYVSVNIFTKRKELAKIIVEEPGKWLVFVDNKEYGRRLIKDIKEYLPEEDKTAHPYVSFITSDYRNNFEMSREVEEIVCYEKQDARVLIATSVLDNGINLKDEDLLNIAILTDTETEFIQMLGRKRTNNGKINLYLFSSSKEHFEKRCRINDRRVKIAENNYTYVSKVVEQAFKMNCPREQICIKEIMAIVTQHKYIVNGMINKSIQAEDVFALFTECKGTLCLNELAFENVENLNQYYNRIIDEFDDLGEDAFLRTQLRWLNKSDEEIDAILEDSKLTQFERAWKRVVKKFDSLVDIEMSGEEVHELQNEVRFDLITIITYCAKSHEKYDTYYQALYRNDREISKQLVEFLKENCNFPYLLEVKRATKEKAGSKILRRISESENTTPLTNG